MNNKIRKIISFLVVLITIINSATPAFALSFENGQIITLEKDHDCISVLKFKGEDLLKGITYVVYKDQETGRKQPAFCVEPDKEGIGTGAGDNYDVTLSLLRDQKLWRVLYKGYMGSKYTNWGLQCSDDLYYATKTAIHCLVDGVAPNDKYEVPDRVGWGENVSLSEVQKRGSKVLEVAQTLYNYGINGGDNYLTPELYVNKRGEIEKQEINGEQYLVQKFYLTGNREIYTYKVDISNFPEGTKILNSANVETNLMKNVTFKIAIPTSKIIDNIAGDIKIVDAKAKSYPIFFAKSYIEELQSYVIYADNVEDVTTDSRLNIDAYKSGIEIIKTDEETKKKLEGVTFNVKYSDTNQNIGDFTTDESGKISITGLRRGKITITEKSTKEGYVLDTNPIEIELEYNQIKQVEIHNSLKKGNLKITKIDKDDNKITIPDVEFQLVDSDNNLIGEYKTDGNGEINVEGLKTGEYVLKETLAPSHYYPLDDEIIVQINWKETTEIKIENELKKGQIKVVKVDKENEKIKLEGVTFEILDEKGNLLEKITTDENGEAITKEYSVREYENLIIREIETKEKYILNEEPKMVKLEANQIKTIVIQNEKEKPKLEVNVEKTGFSEVESNQSIYYDFKNIQNNSNVELNNFIWSDVLPTDAVRVDRIFTGTWNQELEYSIWYKTNKNDYKVIAQNLNSQINNEIDFGNIELEGDEYVTEYEFRFGTVDLGFSEIEQPRLYCNVINNLANGFIFTNNTKVRGEYLKEFIEDTDYWTTIIYNKEKPLTILPQTGR